MFYVKSDSSIQLLVEMFKCRKFESPAKWCFFYSIAWFRLLKQIKKKIAPSTGLGELNVKYSIVTIESVHRDKLWPYIALLYPIFLVMVLVQYFMLIKNHIKT